MADIRHRVGIAAPQAQVFDTLTTTEGMSRWWTTEVRGDAKLGGRMEFFFGRSEPDAIVKVIELDPPRRAVLRFVQGPADWVDTELTFDLSVSDGQTIVLFSHASWRNPAEFMSHCSTKWAYYMLGLKAGMEGGTYTPFPDETKISPWG